MLLPLAVATPLEGLLDFGLDLGPLGDQALQVGQRGDFFLDQR
ncbi:hypothetical protein [Planctomyces sp. SH-PL62]|nr:hypothetical protein [Planctomyces sp. SH-PL62]